jgi:four helix bundle protein
MDLEPIQPRLAAFARDIRLFATGLLDRPNARDAAQQLIRAASGAAANHRAAQRGRSYAEFRSKLDVALEEADEAQFWLEHIDDCGLVPADRLTALEREAGELVAILTKASKTASGRKRPSDRPPRRRHPRRG